MRDNVNRPARDIWRLVGELRRSADWYESYLADLGALLVLKLIDEEPGLPVLRATVPRDCRWADLERVVDSPDLVETYVKLADRLARLPGSVGLAFRSRITPRQVALRNMVEWLGSKSWSQLSEGGQGDLFEELVERDTQPRGGTAHVYTPRVLVDAITACLDPRPGEFVFDPACGTAGFLVAAAEHAQAMGSDGALQLQGIDLNEHAARLAAINLLLHGIPDNPGDSSPIVVGDALASVPPRVADVVVVDPPFGRGSDPIHGQHRWANTRDNSLQFLQHAAMSLAVGGRAAVLVPDAALTGSGPGAAIRRHLLDHYNVHTLLRLPRGALRTSTLAVNVLFFDRVDRRGAPATRSLRVYDFRTNVKLDPRHRTLSKHDLAEFVAGYRPEAATTDGETSRWRRFGYGELVERDDCNLDLLWLRDASDDITDAQIEELVERYELELARYEEAAAAVERVLWRELRSAGIPALLSARAKHPDDVRGKLRNRRDKPRYRFPALSRNLNLVMNDLAGCRIVVYDPRHEAAAAQMVSRIFPRWSGEGAFEAKDDESGYHATHILVMLGGEERPSLRGAIVEIQVTPIANHVFNEIEHDILYKHHGVPAGAQVKASLKELLHASRILDGTVGRVIEGRRVERDEAVIDDAERLRAEIEPLFGRQVSGDVFRLFELLGAIVSPLTVRSLRDLELSRHHRLGTAATPDVPDDVTAIAVSLARDFRAVVEQIVSAWDESAAAMKRAILGGDHGGT